MNITYSNCLTIISIDNFVKISFIMSKLIILLIAYLSFLHALL